MWPQNPMSKQIGVLAKRVDSKSRIIRGQRVILDTDLAELYGVEVRQLNQQVKSNARRFPDDFVIQLSAEEAGNLQSHNLISISSSGGATDPPLASHRNAAPTSPPTIAPP